MKLDLLQKHYQPMKISNSSFLDRSAVLALAIGLAASIMALPLFAAGEQRFDSPEAAVTALTDAAKAKDTNAVHAIFGPEGHELMSPDIVQASEGFNHFVKRLSEKTELVRESDSKELLEIGADRWPFPMPLVKDGGKWYFDVAAGREEILNRRIGHDELGAIDVCHAYVAAQREYAGRDRMGDGVLAYAQYIMSTPGKHDGLYWPAKNPEDETSPLGPFVAQAHQEGYHRRTGLFTENQTPYHGYYFEVILRQGKHAPGGKYSYIVNGHMIGGFALVAWPAEWGNSGVMTFVVNQQGKVFQKNLGPKTDSLARKITTYDPDDTWMPAEGK
jgi:Protein of unknown function (DUF2950)